MNKDKVIDSLGRIDDDMVQSIDALRRRKKHPVWTKWCAMAACFCLLLAAAASQGLFPDNTPTEPDSSDFPVQTEWNQTEASKETQVPTPLWTVYYNEASSVLSAERAYIKGYFTENLDDTKLAALTPEMPYAYMICSGYAGFDNYGNLLDVVLSVTTSIPEAPVTVSLMDYSFAPCYVLPGEATLSVCEKVEYTLYQYDTGSQITLGADAFISGIYFHFSIDTTQEKLEQSKADFQCVLECFARYEDGKPDLSVITPGQIPELTEQIFNTLSEAQSEPDFGQYMPSQLPAGFEEAAIRRFKFQNANYLSGLWSKGLDDLSWVVSPYTEADARRLTGINEKENYDLSLYPIPRADSVPDGLREIVDDPIFAAEELTLDAIYCRAYKISDAGDTDGWRMRFSVRYGDIIVSVSAKGVEPEWLYQQLVNLLSE